MPADEGRKGPKFSRDEDEDTCRSGEDGGEDESFHGSTLNFSLFFNESRRSYISPEIRCPSTPSPMSSIDRSLHTQEHVWILCFHLHPSLCQAALKRSLKKKKTIAGFLGGLYRRISQSLFSDAASELRLGREKEKNKKAKTIEWMGYAKKRRRCRENHRTHSADGGVGVLSCVIPGTRLASCMHA